jgi:hypothetical protein
LGRLILALNLAGDALLYHDRPAELRVELRDAPRSWLIERVQGEQHEMDAVDDWHTELAATGLQGVDVERVEIARETGEGRLSILVDQHLT